MPTNCWIVAASLLIGLQCINGVSQSPDPVAATQAGDQLLKVIVISRHGIRAPLQTTKELERYSTSPWPQWDVPPGNLTTHGKDVMRSLGKFYAAYYGRRGLFQDGPCGRARNSFAWSDVDERDISTAKSFFEGLAPQCEMQIHSVGEGRVDPLLHPLKAHLGHPDLALALSSVQGRIGSDAEYVMQSYMPAFLALDRVLGGCGIAVCQKENENRTILFTMNARIEQADDDDHFIRESTGPLGIASTLGEILLLEYADGKPMTDVGFGRMSRSQLTQILSLHSLYFDLANETPYIAQVQASNLDEPRAASS